MDYSAHTDRRMLAAKLGPPLVAGVLLARSTGSSGPRACDARRAVEGINAAALFPRLAPSLQEAARWRR